MFPACNLLVNAISNSIESHLLTRISVRFGACNVGSIGTIPSRWDFGPFLGQSHSIGTFFSERRS